MFEKKTTTIKQQIALLKHRGLLNVITPGNRLTEKLDHLLKKYPNVDPDALGMKQNWQNEALWKS